MNIILLYLSLFIILIIGIIFSFFGFFISKNVLSSKYKRDLTDLFKKATKQYQDNLTNLDNETKSINLLCQKIPDEISSIIDKKIDDLKSLNTIINSENSAEYIDEFFSSMKKDYSYITPKKSNPEDYYLGAKTFLMKKIEEYEFEVKTKYNICSISNDEKNNLIDALNYFKTEYTNLIKTDYLKEVLYFINNKRLANTILIKRNEDILTKNISTIKENIENAQQNHSLSKNYSDNIINFNIESCMPYYGIEVGSRVALNYYGEKIGKVIRFNDDQAVISSITTQKTYQSRVKDLIVL